jgi:hypothetical protein
MNSAPTPDNMKGLEAAGPARADTLTGP